MRTVTLTIKVDEKETKELKLEIPWKWFVILLIVFVSLLIREIDDSTIQLLLDRLK